MTRDEFLTTKMLGECWHEWEWWTKPDRYRRKRCIKCGVDVSSGNQITKMNNFSTPEGFFKLWNFCKEQGWFNDFIINGEPIGVPLLLINPDVFAESIARYFKWEGE